ncbi:MAG: alanine racemase, partial [Nitriliruptorales bacterium]
MTKRARPTYAEVDLGAIAHNVRVVRDRIAPAEVIAVVKADGYGHGAVEVAQAALGAGASSLAVALVEEGEELRAAGVSAPILLMAEPPPEAADRVVACDLVPALYTRRFAAALRAEADRRDAPVTVHVKADTGMARVGVPRDSWDAILDDLGEMKAELDIGAFWTHFACADERGHASVRDQLDAFGAFLDRARAHGITAPRVHVGNSAAALTLDPEELGGAVRLGIAMYGIPPSPALAGAADLRP